MARLIRQNLERLHGSTCLRELDLDKPRDLTNREHLDNCGAHNRIPLTKRVEVLNGRHDVQGIKSYIRAFQQDHGRVPKVCKVYRP
jgi:hypothetical protein